MMGPTNGYWFIIISIWDLLSSGCHPFDTTTCRIIQWIVTFSKDYKWQIYNLHWEPKYDEEASENGWISVCTIEDDFTSRLRCTPGSTYSTEVVPTETNYQLDRESPRW